MKRFQSNPQRFAVAISILLLIMLVTKIRNDAAHRAALAELTVTNPANAASELDCSKADMTSKKRYQKFLAVWSQHNTRDVGPDLVPFLNDAHPGIRHLAMRAFTLLESPAGRSAIAKIIKMNTGKSTLRKDELTAYKWALGRINSHGLKGQQKIDAALTPLGITWTDMGPLSKTVYRDIVKHYGTGALVVVEGMTEMLHGEQRRGEHYEKFCKQLWLRPIYRVALDTSNQSAEKEANAIIQYLSDGLGLGYEERTAINRYFVPLGSVAASRLKLKLQTMSNNPSLDIEAKKPVFAQKFAPGHTLLFFAAFATRRADLGPVLKRFESNKNPRIVDAARKWRKSLEGISGIDYPTDLN